MPQANSLSVNSTILVRALGVQDLRHTVRHTVCEPSRVGLYLSFLRRMHSTLLGKCDVSRSPMHRLVI